MSTSIDFQNRDRLELAQLSLDGSLDWLTTAKQNALTEFKCAALPSRKVEHWKYNETAFLRDQHFKVAQPASAQQQANVIECTAKIELNQAVELVMVDGYLVTPLADLKLPAGLKITPFSETNDNQQQIILSHIDAEFNARNLLINLNESVNQNGILIEVAANKAIENSVYIRHLTTNQSDAAITSQKVILQVGSSASLTLVEQFNDQVQSTNQLALQQTSIELMANSQLMHYRLNLDSDNATQVSQVKTKIGKDAVANSFYIGLGGRLIRTDIDVLHVGENAECNMTGIYLPANEQRIDYHTNIEHRVAHCRTNEVFRGIIADKASATFNGKIHIFQDAQKSDAQLNNKNLLLTNQAEVNTKPELEIYADDVKCAHGATVAQLDEKSVYYLQTRGINRQKAKKMLSVAFVQELLNTIKLGPVKTYLGGMIDDYMSKIA
jgi:Fe-S cluster assembly protein SufD